MDIFRIILVGILILLAQQFAYAAYPVSSVQQTFAVSKATAVKYESRKTSSFISFFHSRSAQAKYFSSHPDPTHHNVKGIAGTLSFIFGLCSIIPIVGILFGIPAIVIGLIGVHKHQKHALAGLILGACTTVLGIIITLVIIASLSAV